jgi:tetratricopeptide (TPR) repeat protein
LKGHGLLSGPSLKKHNKPLKPITARIVWSIFLTHKVELPTVNTYGSNNVSEELDGGCTKTHRLPCLKGIMRYRGKLVLVLALAGLLFSQVVQALTMEPPLPAACAQAEKAADPEAKVSLYTRCLDGSDKHDRPLEAYQRDKMYFHRANALFELRRYAEALIDYDRVISNAHSGHVWALHQRGLTHEALGQRKLAAADFDRALELNPDAISVRFDRGQLFAGMGLYQAAIEDLSKAVTLSPETAEYANALAWLLATCPDAKLQDGREAVHFALKAVSIDRNAQYLDTLAAAHARKGDFKKAVETQKTALDLLRKDKAEQETIKEFTTRLNLYTAGKPYTQHRPE